MKIAFLIPAIDAMGPNIFIQNLISGLSDYPDFQCEVFHFDRGSKDIRQLKFSVKVTKLDFNKRYDFNGFDILHSNMPVPDLYIVRHKLYKMFLCVTTMHCFYETDLVQRKGQLIGMFQKLLWKYALNKFRNIIVSSTEMKEYYEQELLPMHTYTIIPYGIPELKCSQVDTSIVAMISNLKKQYKVICSCGTLIKRKGFHQLINYLSYNPDAAVILIGRGILEVELRQLASKLNVMDRLFFLGYLDEPYKYYPYMDVFVMCSNSEGFGLALLEAMQQGVPVVCTNLGIYKDYFDEKEVGLFDFGNQVSFNNAVNKVLHNKAYYASQALKLSETTFSLKNMGKRHYEYYSKLLKK